MHPWTTGGSGTISMTQLATAGHDGVTSILKEWSCLCIAGKSRYKQSTYPPCAMLHTGAMISRYYHAKEAAYEVYAFKYGV
jgi:hypothetical protein